MPAPTTSSMNKSAAAFTPKRGAATPPAGPASAAAEPIALAEVTKPRGRKQFTRDQLKAVQRRMRDAVGNRIFEWMLHTWIKHHHELIDPDQLAFAAKRNPFPETCPACIGKLRLAPPPQRFTDPLVEKETWADPPCGAIQDIVDAVVAEERTKHGAFLLQDPMVIFGQIELQLLFDSPCATRRMKRLKADAPAAYSAIKAFLCGPGYHAAPPKADNHAAWDALTQRLKFDLIRDNRTPIYTELGRQWKKRHTPFEQFAHFLFFRDAVPPGPAFNMITHAQKPALVAAVCGDTSAFVLLARLGFAMPSDAQWERTAFLRDALDTRRYAVLRHLNAYFYRRQFKAPAPIIRLSFAPAPVSLSLDNSPAFGPAAPGTAYDGVGGSLGDDLPPNHPALRVWEPRPPRKSHATTASSRGRSPLDDQAFAATLPSTSPNAAPAAPGSAQRTTSWANIARKSSTPAVTPATGPSATAGASVTSVPPMPMVSPAAKPATPAAVTPAVTPATAPAQPAPVPKAEPAAEAGSQKQPAPAQQKGRKATHVDPNAKPPKRPASATEGAKTPATAPKTPAKTPKGGAKLPPAPELPPADPKAADPKAKGGDATPPKRKNAWGV